MADEPSTPDAPEPDAPTDEPGNQPDEPQEDWKANSRKWEREAKKAQRDLVAAQQANETAAEAALRTAREEAEQAARNELVPELTRARLEVAVLRSAGTKLADPADALSFIDPASVTNDDGTVDTKKLGAAIDALIASKPYLAAGHKPGPVSVPGGPRGATDGPTGMNAILRQGRSTT